MQFLKALSLQHFLQGFFELYVIKTGSLTCVEKEPDVSRVNSRDGILLDRQRGVVFVLHVGLDVLPIED
jgi:hypothetical protein